MPAPRRQRSGSADEEPVRPCRDDVAAAGAGGEGEKRGKLADQSSGKKNLLVLRAGALRVFRVSSRSGRHGAQLSHVLLASRCEVRALPGACLEVQGHVPVAVRHVFQAASESEAAEWCQALERAAVAARRALQKHLLLLSEGGTAYKYNYSNSKRMRRVFWVDEGKVQVCWGKSRSDEPQVMDLAECAGIIFGPVTSTFAAAVRYSTLEDPPWCCFSLLFHDRTLDMAVPEDVLSSWFLGVQHMLLERDPSTHQARCVCESALSSAQLAFRGAQLRLQQSAREHNLTTRVLLLSRLRGLGPSGSPPGSRRGPPRAPVEAWGEANPVKEERTRRRDSKEAAAAAAGRPPKRGSGGGADGAAPDDGEELEQLVAALEAELEAAGAELEAAAPGVGCWRDWLPAAAFGGPPAAGEAERYAGLEEEELGLRLELARARRRVQAAEKSGKQLKKLARQLQESEAALAALAERPPGGPPPAAPAPDAGAPGGGAELARLEQQARELERQLQEAERGGGSAGAAAHLSPEQAEELRRLEQERDGLLKRVEQKDAECHALRRRQVEDERLRAGAEGASQRLVGLLQALQAEVAQLRGAQARARSDWEPQVRGLAASLAPLGDAVRRAGAELDRLAGRSRDLGAEVQKLNDLVLQLQAQAGSDEAQPPPKPKRSSKLGA